MVFPFSMKTITNRRQDAVRLASAQVRIMNQTREVDT